jgi:putative hydrolase
MIRLNEDHHVHSTFSDGRGTVLEMAEKARDMGLRELGFADHVRRSSDWLESYVEAIAKAQAQVPEVKLRVGVEAKMLDRLGTIDMPDLPKGIDRVIIADHQIPGYAKPIHPKLVRRGIEAGLLRPETVIERLVESTRLAILQCPRPVIVGHLFSILPKAGIQADSVDPAVVDPLLEACLEHGARIEIDERWSCPSLAIARRALAAGVEVIASSDSHVVAAVGRYRYVRALSEELALAAVA